MNFASKKNGEPRRRSEQQSDTEASTKSRPKRRKRPGETTEVGQALRAAYERTIGEAIPSEMLDLLGKLG